MSKNGLTIHRVEHPGGLVLRFHFSDGHRNEVNLEPWIKVLPTEEERAYLKPTRFKQYRIHLGHAIMWGDYDIIFPLVALYHGDPDLLEEGVAVTMPKRSARVRAVKTVAVRKATARTREKRPKTKA